MTQKEWFESPGCCDGEFLSEEYLVQAIRNLLLTETQRKTLFNLNLSIEDMLNGRYNDTQEQQVLLMFSEWNNTLGFKTFGF